MSDLDAEDFSLDSDSVEIHVPEHPQRPAAGPGRKRFLTVLGFAVGIGLATSIIAARAIDEEYLVEGIVMTARVDRTPAVFPDDDPVSLVKSRGVADSVVNRAQLFLKAPNNDRRFFTGLRLSGEPVIPGAYRFVIDAPAKRWVLTPLMNSAPSDSGSRMEPIGRALGFAWQPDTLDFEGDERHAVEFTIVSPSDAAIAVGNRVIASRKGLFLTVSYQDRDPRLAASVVNAYLSTVTDICNDHKERDFDAVETASLTQVAAAKHDVAVAATEGERQAATRRYATARRRAVDAATAWLSDRPGAQLLDTATVPLAPNKNRMGNTISIAFVSGFCGTFLGAFVLALLARRFQ